MHCIGEVNKFDHKQYRQNHIIRQKFVLPPLLLTVVVTGGLVVVEVVVLVVLIIQAEYELKEDVQQNKKQISLPCIRIRTFRGWDLISGIPLKITPKSFNKLGLKIGHSTIRTEWLVV